MCCSIRPCALLLTLALTLGMAGVTLDAMAQGAGRPAPVGPE